MKLLYSNILPLETLEKQQTIIERFNEEFGKADRVDISVGYVSHASLKELEQLVFKHGIKNICLNIGMYFIEGMPESSYHTAIRINKKWQADGIGEIRLIKTFKYHGKLYCFYKEEIPFSAIIGSANLSVIKLEANNRRQYEIAAITTEEAEVTEIAKHIEDLRSFGCSSNIGDIEKISLIHDVNSALNGIELITQVPQSNVEFYKKCVGETSFCLPLKVPKFSERYMDDKKHFTKSNINVCYAAPRNKHKSRDWYETQLTVSKEIREIKGYPEKHKPFFIITDDGYWFKAHTTSDANKQFNAVGDELILGKWIKGRLVAAGLVNPVNDTQLDTERIGMITKEMLDEYGCDHLVLKKTGQTALNEEGNQMDVWYLSFESKNSK